MAIEKHGSPPSCLCGDVFDGKNLCGPSSLPCPPWLSFSEGRVDDRPAGNGYSERRMSQSKRRFLTRIAATAAVLAFGPLLRGAAQSNRTAPDKSDKKWTVGRTPDGQPDL